MFRNPALVFVAIALAFFITSWVLIPANLVAGIMGTIGLVIAIAIVWRWWPSAIRSFKAGARQQFEQHNLAIVAVFGGLGLTRAASLSFRIAGQPDWWPDSFISIGLLYVIVVGLWLYLLATRRQSDPPLRVWLLVTAGVAVLSLILGLAIAILTGGAN